MLPAISPAVISHLAMPNSGVHRYAAALQSLVSAGARDRLTRAEEPVVRRLCAGGKWIRTCMGLFLSSSRFWCVVCSLFGAGKPFFVPSPAIRFAERAEGVKGPKR